MSCCNSILSECSDGLRRKQHLFLFAVAAHFYSILYFCFSEFTQEWNYYES